MKNNKLIFLLLLVNISLPLKAQFNLHLTTSFASVRYHPTLPTVNINYFPDKGSFTIGAEAEFKIRGSNRSQAYLSLRSGISLLNAGYDYVQVFPDDNFETTSKLDKMYLRMPVITRLYYQPMPLVENFDIFLGGGVVINKVQKINLAETYQTGTEKYSDNQDVLSFSKPQYLFSLVEMGMNYKRIEVAFRIQSSLESLYLDGLEKSWRVPVEKSEYFKRHLAESTVESKEVILELMVAFKLF